MSLQLKVILKRPELAMMLLMFLEISRLIPGEDYMCKALYKVMFNMMLYMLRVDLKLNMVSRVV